MGGAFLQEKRAVRVPQNKPVERQGRHGLRVFAAGQFGGAALFAGQADVGHRAGGALRFGAGADGCAEIHQPLGVGGHVGGVGGQQAFGQRPQALPEFFVGRVALACENAAEDAFDVAVEDGFALAEGEGGDGGGGAAADAAEGFETGAASGERAAVLCGDLFGGFVQVAGAAVIAQPLPEGEHLVFGRGGKGGGGGEGGEKARVVSGNGGHLGLLQHDFGEPDAVGVAAVPGQVVAAVLFLPADEAVGEGVGAAV